MPTPTPNKPAQSPGRFSLLYILIAVWGFILIRDLAGTRKNMEEIPYSQFLAYVDGGRVSEVAIGMERIEGKLKDPPKDKLSEFVTGKVEDPTLTAKLTTAKVKFSGFRESTFLRDITSWMLPALFIVMIWIFIMRRLSGQAARGGGGFLAMGKSKAKIYIEKELKIRFGDVAGVDEGKEELSEIVNFLKNPVRYSRLGGRMPKGVLLIGPPGTGKTLLARAVAGEAGVPFFSINGSEFVELFVGLGAARVRDLFEQARAHAPCIIFIDELDALGKARGLSAISGGGNDEKEQTLNQLLAEMDGFDPSRGVILLAATNRPEVLDPALLRAGRFDRQIMIDKPDRLGRLKILEIHLRKVKISPEVNKDTVAGLTTGFSGADLANLVNEAALIATRRGANQVELRDCTEAIERIVAGLERKSRILAADEKRRVAFHEMGHATVSLALGASETVHKVSVIPRGIGALGYTMRRPIEDRYLMSSRELEDKLAVALGGRAAEQMFFEDVSTGAADDLDKATEIARAMVTRYGMNNRIGLAILEREPTPVLGGQIAARSYEYSEDTAVKVDAEIKAMLERALARASEILAEYRQMVLEGAQLLLLRETINELELKDLWMAHQEGLARAA